MTHPTPLFWENVNSTVTEQGQMIDIFCDISVSHGDDYENYYLLGHVTV